MRARAVGECWVGRAIFWLICWLAGTAVALADPTPARLEVFVREGCPHCAAAKAYLPAFAASRPGLQVVLRQVDRDPAAQRDWQRVSQASGVWPPGLPTFAIQGRLMVGFDDEQRTGPLLAALVDQAVVAPALESGWLGTLSVERLGLPLFTLAIGLLDGFNPCAMWVLLFLLSMLVHLRSRARIALIAGTFVATGGLIYFAFLAAWLNLFLLLPLTDALRWGLAALALAIGGVNVADAARGGSDFTLAIPASVKPGLYARARAVLRGETLLASMAGVMVLAVVVNFVELLCSAGLPALYSAVLAQQPLDQWQRTGYLALYIVGYVADDSLMVALAVTALGSSKLSERSGRWLKLVSGLTMLAMGGLLVLKPGWLL